MKKSVNLTTGVAGNDVRDALRYNYDVEALPRLLVDWNMNRYTLPTAENSLPEKDYGYDVEIFPISSITDVVRPGTKGIAKALVGQSIVSSRYSEPTAPKFYTGDKNDIYKYWISPTTTKSDRTFPKVNEVDGSRNTNTTSSVQPTVNYNRSIKINKIVVRIENTWASPDQWTIQVATNPQLTDWTAVGPANIDVGADGVVALFHGLGGWSTSKPDHLTDTTVTGIRLVVDSMKGGKDRRGLPTKYRSKYVKVVGQNIAAPQATYTNTTGSNSNFSLISIEPHYEVDLTSRLIETSTTFDISDSDQIHPLGVITSNQGSVVLDNSDTVLDQENEDSPYYGLLDANAEFNLQYIYTIGNNQHSVQEFRMFGGAWTPGDGTVSVELLDSSKFLKEIKPIATMYQNKTVNEIIWRILDSVGFSDYEIGLEDVDDKQFVIPIFWTNGEQTVWEVLDELSRATQTAVYFDCRNKLQVRGREAAFRDSATVDWNMHGQKEGINLPDIISLTQTDEMEANKVSVTYKDTAWRTSSYGYPAFSRVWEPEGDSLVVRASALVADLKVDSTTISLHPDDVLVWPYASTINIDSEILSYDAKEYFYYLSNGETNGAKTRQSEWVTTEDEKKALDKKTDVDDRWRNQFSGLLRVKERGMWNSKPALHSVALGNYTVRNEAIFGQPIVGGISHDPRHSVLNTNVMGATMHKIIATGDRFTYNRFGTKVRLNHDGSWNQIAGLWCYGDTNNLGYYFEIMPTSIITNDMRYGQDTHEVQIHSRDFVGRYTRLGQADVPVLEDTWYEMDVDITRDRDTYGEFDYIRLFLNGTLVWASGVRSGLGMMTNNYHFGPFTRYKTNASFEYVYAVDKNVRNLPDYSFYDLKEGAFRGALFEREFVYDITSNYKKRVKTPHLAEELKFDGIYFDDFGPFMHEIREFDVKFDPAPVLTSSLFTTNTFYATLLEYQSTPWGAHFVMANTGRETAILSGEDTLVYAGTGGAVTEVFLILGRDLEITEGEKVEAKNEQAIRTRGVIESELSSDWVQSKEAAQSLADWIVAHWSQTVDQLSVEVFGNPILEIGDIVDISYYTKHMSPETHKYYVIGTSNSFDAGISTTLTLRRVRGMADDVG